MRSEDSIRLGWQPPPRPRWVADMNIAGEGLGPTRLHPIDADSLVATSIEATGLEDFGGTTWRDGFDRLCGALRDEARLHAVGAALTRLELLRTLTNRLRIVGAESAAAGPPTASPGTIREPWFVSGTARSGTSILHELLALDPEQRAPRTWEIMDSVPAPGCATADDQSAPDRPAPDRRAPDRPAPNRLARIDHEVRLWHAIAPEYLTMHENGADLPQECIFITAHEFMSDHWSGVHDVPGYTRWLVRSDQRPAYEWHRRHLEHLQSARPTEHWVLKAPSHLGALPALFSVYPDAWVIQTHRDPCRTIPSTISLMATLRWMRSDHVDVARLRDSMTTGIAQQLASVRSLRTDGAVPDERFVDVRYCDLMRDPVATIRSIYDRTGRSFGNDLVSAIERYVAARPKDRHGAHRYSLGVLGLDEAELRERYAGYCDAYGIPSEE